MAAPPHLPAPDYPGSFVERVDTWMQASGRQVTAIAGLQGTGKSTLAAQLERRATGRGERLAVLSIDDFYLGRRERLKLGREVHPLLATRGPPGTHDVTLACEVIDALVAGHTVRLPRFDKIADRRLPPSRWPRIAADRVLLEGWFLKVPAQSPDQLAEPVNALERTEDPDGTWRTWCNRALAEDYPALWRRLPWLLFLRGPGFETVPAWRWQQEQSLQAANPRRATMSRPQVDRFVRLFERVSRHALATLPTIAQHTVRLDALRRPLD
ncbi:kinase [Lysobacter sp. A3-1-A15]|uniref:kinase n=1 Tax=Novilysobacter viscosus TaxID=3098602 RepID=UPI002ED89D9B